MKKFSVVSPDIKEGYIGQKNSYRGGNISPEFHLSGIDEAAVSMAVVGESADKFPFLKENLWLLWNLPVMDIIPQGLEGGTRSIKGSVQGNIGGYNGYKGPRPLLNIEKKYRFTVYLLDYMPNLGPKCKKEFFIQKIEGHILAEAHIDFKFITEENKNGGEKNGNKNKENK